MSDIIYLNFKSVNFSEAVLNLLRLKDSVKSLTRRGVDDQDKCQTYK